MAKSETEVAALMRSIANRVRKARRVPLPNEKPKPLQEDPEAFKKVLKILDSPTYRQDTIDFRFLSRDEAIQLKLRADYLKPERRLKSHGIKKTVVVFGGSRMKESRSARQQVAVLKEALKRCPDEDNLRQKLNIAERLEARSQYYEIAREFGRLVGNSGYGPLDCKLAIMTGGGPGIMEAANRGANDVGAKSIGLNISLPQKQFPNPYITPELCFKFRFFAMRKLHFLLRTKALVFFPGGYGTLDELFEALRLVQTRTIKPLPIVLVGRSFWERAFDIDFLLEEGEIDIEDKDLFWYSETAHAIWDSILAWYAAKGENLFPHCK